MRAVAPEDFSGRPVVYGNERERSDTLARPGRECNVLSVRRPGFAEEPVFWGPAANDVPCHTIVNRDDCQRLYAAPGPVFERNVLAIGRPDWIVQGAGIIGGELTQICPIDVYDRELLRSLPRLTCLGGRGASWEGESLAVGRTRQMFDYLIVATEQDRSLLLRL